MARVAHRRCVVPAEIARVVVENLAKLGHLMIRLDLALRQQPSEQLGVMEYLQFEPVLA